MGVLIGMFDATDALIPESAGVGLGDGCCVQRSFVVSVFGVLSCRFLCRLAFLLTFVTDNPRCKKDETIGFLMSGMLSSCFCLSIIAGSALGNVADCDIEMI